MINPEKASIDLPGIRAPCGERDDNMAYPEVLFARNAKKEYGVKFNLNFTPYSYARPDNAQASIKNGSLTQPTRREGDMRKPVPEIGFARSANEGEGTTPLRGAWGIFSVSARLRNCRILRVAACGPHEDSTRYSFEEFSFSVSGGITAFFSVFLLTRLCGGGHLLFVL